MLKARLDSGVVVICANVVKDISAISNLALAYFAHRKITPKLVSPEWNELIVSLALACASAKGIVARGELIRHVPEYKTLDTNHGELEAILVDLVKLCTKNQAKLFAVVVKDKVGLDETGRLMLTELTEQLGEVCTRLINSLREGNYLR